MRKRAGVWLGASAAVAALLCVSAATAEAWRQYRNARFGTTADVPKDWAMGEAPENDDGRIFTSPDGRAQIIVHGGFRSFQTEQELAERLAPGDGETVTYRRKGKDWLAVSGTKGDRIFYRRSLLSCNGTVWNNISIDYPAAQKKKLDPVVTRVSRSLRAGRSDHHMTDCP
jgi:serine/threonine-protein kinase